LDATPRICIGKGLTPIINTMKRQVRRKNLMSQTESDHKLLAVVHLLHRAVQVADAAFVRQMGESQLTPRQFAVLVAVSEQPSRNQTNLVAKTGIDRSTLADIVRRLVDDGVLQRKRCKEDVRSYAVRLTPKGEEILSTAEPAAKRANEELLGLLPAKTQSELMTNLWRIVDTIGQQEQPALPKPVRRPKIRAVA
jgi:DNA-binding MarR family transcriptional regulator